MGMLVKAKRAPEISSEEQQAQYQTRDGREETEEIISLLRVYFQD